MLPCFLALPLLLSGCRDSLQLLPPWVEEGIVRIESPGETASADTSIPDTGRDTSGDTAHHETGDTIPVDTGPDCVDYSTWQEDSGVCVTPPVVGSSGAGTFWDDVDPEDSGLLSAIHEVIDDHDSVSYDDLWDRFPTTDARDDGTVWDLYSDVPDGPEAYTYRFDADACGQYGCESDCYNREHTWPSSWFNDNSPMKSDLFQVYPTDGYVNGMRSDNPYGEVMTPRWTSTNGSLLGTSLVCDFQDTVFEPIDEYKGDLARTYFYMAARYQGEDAGWLTNTMVTGAHINAEAEAMLRKWHFDDPVSEKEIDRNNAVCQVQGNRNPFIDHPEWICLIPDF